MIKTTTITVRVIEEIKAKLGNVEKEDDRKIYYLIQKIVEQLLEEESEVI